MHTLNDIQLTI